ncbi:hypothetical protein NOR_06158 [Metarhizium rileyi]|uniref:Uncharacterized protein n=1 Tax=Metarhizium rileyi (strain RCEF 4871) TaxID=1649241 RepID=A0A162J5J2_METRR|nr:hypothetical protein NOR_06158 [Metarhizium rileyi RCEF 4871]
MSFMKFQLRMLDYGGVSVMPLSTAGQLIPQLDALQNQALAGMKRVAQVNSRAAQKDLLRHCVSGPPLSVKQVDILLSTVGNLRELAGMVQSQEGQDGICQILGAADGRSLITYFADGPRRTRCQAEQESSQV